MYSFTFVEAIEMARDLNSYSRHTQEEILSMLHLYSDLATTKEQKEINNILDGGSK